MGRFNRYPAKTAGTQKLTRCDPGSFRSIRNKPLAAAAVVPRTSDQRLKALVEHTADLDKARVLQAALPHWLAAAGRDGVQVLKEALRQSLVFQAFARIRRRKTNRLGWHASATARGNGSGSLLSQAASSSADNGAVIKPREP